MILSPSKPRARAGLGRRLLLAGLSALLTLILTACGASAPRAGNITNASPNTPHPTVSAELKTHPCQGVYTNGFNPAVTLTDPIKPTISVTGSARTGDTIEIRMDGHHKWILRGIMPAGALTPISEEGIYDSVNNVCVWVFHATATGDATINLSGGYFPCPCVLIGFQQIFTLHIS